MHMKAVAIIPARYASTRFPGKPLVQIKGKAMIQHVYERCQLVFEEVYVATDDQRIHDAVQGFGGKALMTAKTHQSGTDRCAEAARIIQKSSNIEIIVNVQGDEPFIHTEQLNQIIQCFEKANTQIATLLTPIKDQAILFDPNAVKAVVSEDGRALYFSRMAIPFQRDVAMDAWLDRQTYYLHIGLYAYRFNVLQELTRLAPGRLEQMEKLEQLRWLENGYHIQTAITKHQTMGIDTPDDLEKLNESAKA